MTIEVLIHAMFVVLAVDTALAIIIFGGDKWK